MNNSAIETNRELYLLALRSGKYQKGTIRSDEKGKPIIESEKDEGSCACAIMHDLFFQNKSKDFLIALNITVEDCRFIQQNLNDSPMTFKAIADVIESQIFQ